MIQADLKPGDRLAVLSANDHADLLIAEPTIDRAATQRIVESIPQTQARSEFSSALREARKIAVRAERGARSSSPTTRKARGGSIRRRCSTTRGAKPKSS